MVSYWLHSVSFVPFESVFYDEFCKLQKIEKRTLKIARLRKTGKISNESPPKVGFLGSENVSICF